MAEICALPEVIADFVRAGIHSCARLGEVHTATGWDLRLAEEMEITDPPTVSEISALCASKAAS